ncbi:MAG: hypothetical protein WC234_01305 [Endomicrobiaceae bacterium]
MELAIEMKLYDNLIFKEKFDRLYFADAFCQNLIPKKEVLLKAVKSAQNNGVKFTLNTPYVTDKGIKQILENTELLSKHESDFEIVFNDWGVFYEIQKRFPEAKLVLGRLLTKQRTDPNARSIILNRQTANLKTHKFPKKIPESMYKHFQGSIINDSVFQKYLAKNKIKRVEIEYLMWNMDIKLNSKLKASVYYPYAHITTTRNCGLLNMTYSKCDKICKNVSIEYNDAQMDFPYTVIGNTVYYKINDITKIKKYKAVNRIVFNNLKTYREYRSGNRT